MNRSLLVPATNLPIVRDLMLIDFVLNLGHIARH